VSQFSVFPRVLLNIEKLAKIYLYLFNVVNIHNELINSFESELMTLDIMRNDQMYFQLHHQYNKRR